MKHFAEAHTSRQAGVSALIKFTLDRTLAAVLLPVLVAPIAIIALLIRVTMGSPVFFIQPRAGRDGQLFRLLKFRTMRSARYSSGRLLSDQERLTTIGRLLRASSLDELPQLWNVLRGELSLVGPRPLLSDYLPLYSAPQQRRHEVMPGITGWAQVNGRNSLEWERKLELDVWYVDHWNLLLDLRILAKTAACVILRTGISYGSEATMPFFRGSQTTRPTDTLQ